MVSDETYELCLPVLLDSSLSADEDERTDRLEALLRSRTTLTGTALENAILDVLWRFREGGAGPATSPPPIRQTIMRRPSPAISNSGSSIGIAGGWRAAAGAQTPLSGSPRLGVSPLAPPGFGRPGGAGMGGSMGGTATPGSRGGGGAAVGASPFSSPRPSPRLAFASASAASQPMPILPHPSPGLHAYDFGTSSSFGAGPAGRLLDDSTATPMSAGPDGPAFYLTDDLAQQAETAVDWLVADNNNSSNNNDDVSVASSDRGGAAITAGVGSLSISSGGGGSSSGSTSVGVGGGGSSGGTSTSGGGSSSSGSGLNAAVPEFVSQAQLGGQQASTVLPSFGTAGVAEMTPYDMLRSILGPGRTDEEIESALAMHGYDLSSTIVAMMDTAGVGDASVGGGFNGLGAGIGVPPGLQSAGVDDHAQQKAASLLVSRSMTPGERPTTPGSQKSGVICKFYLATGQCLRADCRFSHDLASHVCKYWAVGKCLAGDTCVFSHDPIHLASRLGLEGSSTPPPRQANLSLQDYTAFPALQQTPEHQQGSNAGNPTVGVTPPPGLKPFHPYVGVASGDRPRSRPGSRHQQHHGHHGSNSHQKESSTAPSLDDTEAFPSLGAAASSKQAGGGQGGTGGSSGKKHHGKRGGHGHGHGKEAAGAATPPSTASSLADIVKMAPSPSPGQSPSHQQSGSSSSSTSLAPPRFGGAAEKEQQRRLGRNGSPANLRNGAASGAAADGNSGGGGPNSAAAANIPSPRHIPWLETGERANKAYLKARQEAIKHGGLRNKFLQSAAQAWNRNDARAAKALSLRGQSENDMMRKAHREAARELYEDRNRRLPSSRTSNDGGDDGTESLPEIYCDLHGLHPDEAVEYLERVLLENAAETRPVYAITGTGGGSHHSGANGGAAGSGTNGSGGGRSGKDKVGRAVRAFLNEWRYAYREFSVPGDRSGSGGILGIDARSYDRGLAQREGGVAIGGNSSNSNRGGSGGGGSGKSAASSANTSGAAADGASTAAGKESEKQQQPATTAESLLDQGREIGDGKVKLLVRGGGPSSSSGTATTAGNEPPKGPSAGRR